MRPLALVSPHHSTRRKPLTKQQQQTMYGRDGKADEHVRSRSGDAIAGMEINFFPPGAADGGSGHDRGPRHHHHPPQSWLLDGVLR